MGKKRMAAMYRIVRQKGRIKGPAYTPSLIDTIYIRDKGICFWCGKKVVRNSLMEDNRATKDHVLPSSKGGVNKPENVVLACYPCNYNKGNKLINPKTKQQISPSVLAVFLRIMEA